MFNGEKLKKLREDKNMSLREFAETIPIAHTAIAKYEKGIVSPNADVLKVIADNLGVPIIELYTN